MIIIKKIITIKHIYFSYIKKRIGWKSHHRNINDRSEKRPTHKSNYFKATLLSVNTYSMDNTKRVSTFWVKLPPCKNLKHFHNLYQMSCNNHTKVIHRDRQKEGSFSSLTGNLFTSVSYKLIISIKQLICKYITVNHVSEF